MFTREITGPVRDGNELQLSGPSGAAVGLGLALVTVAPVAVFLSDLTAMQFLAVQLGFVAAVYFGYAIADGRIGTMLIEIPVAGVFLALATVALWADSPLLLAGSYAAHGIWDLVHHPRAVTTPVRSWYPPFCVVYDVVLAAFIVAWLPLGGVN